MEIHQGEKLRAYVRKLKNENGKKVSEIADEMGITKEWLSTCFSQPTLSAEIRDKAIKALNLRPDFFDVINGVGTPAHPNQESEAEQKERLIRENKDLRDLLDIHKKYITLLESKLKNSSH